ncbi:MAG TPA: aromatic amino acid transport family protein [Actinomycetota bacterium]|nr:aromatic amino acid transport family protein [Actinomycetota bacterium]
MTSDQSGFFSRSELLGGLPARRASTLLFAIEARAAHRVARSRRAMATYLTERTAEEGEKAFLEAMAGGRQLPLTPTIQDLERHAGAWAELVPADRGVRAAVAALLGQKYTFPRDRIPNTREVLGLDQQPTAAAFEAQQKRPLDSIYASTLPFSERLRWARSSFAARIENLPPFWMAYALTLTEMIGAGVLVLPIALAGAGPMLGLVILVVLGLLNMATIAGLVEAITRDGSMRYGRAYFGRLAASLLGRAGGSTITTTLVALNVVSLLAYLMAFGSALEGATRVTAAIWVAALFLVNLFFLTRRDLGATVATAIVIAAVNIGLILSICVLALTRVDAAKLTSGPAPGSGVAVLSLAFGVVLVAFFGHTSAGNVAKVVLEREPSGRGLMRGSVAATATVMGVYALCIVAVSGAVERRALVNFEGTVITPLADRVGPSIDVLGAVYVALAIGLGSIYMSLGLFNQIQEWLPRSVNVSSGLARLAANPSGRFWLGVLPAFLTFLVLEWLIATNRASFAEPLSLIGTITLPLLGGIFPMLLLAASRRRGDYVPDSALRLLGNRTVIAFVAAVFFVGVLVQGFVIWQKPAERLLAAAAVLLMAGVSMIAARRGAFRPRSVIEIRGEPSGAGVVSVTIAGSPGDVSMRIEDDGGERDVRGSGQRIQRFEKLRSVTFDLPSTEVRQLKVWVHRITGERESEGIPATVRLESNAGATEVATEEEDGTVVIAVPDDPMRVQVAVDGAGT